MGMRNGAFATVWEVKNGSGNYTDVRISTSKKNKQTDKWETDYSGFVRFVGTAHQNASSLKEKDRIKIGDCEITNRYDNDKKITYTNVAVFSFEMADGAGAAKEAPAGRPSPATAKDAFVNVADAIDEELPFA